MKSHQVENKSAETQRSLALNYANMTGASQRQAKWPLKTHPFQISVIQGDPKESQTRFRKCFKKRAELNANSLRSPHV